MRAEDIFGQTLDEDLKSFKKKMGIGMAGVGLAAAAAHGLPKKEPVSWEQSLRDDGADLGLDVQFKYGGEPNDIAADPEDYDRDLRSEREHWKQDVVDDAAKLGIKAEFTGGDSTDALPSGVTTASSPKKSNAVAKGKTKKPSMSKMPTKGFVPRREIDWMALTMWGEARSHGPEGMRAVGHVIKNRAMANRPDTFGSGIKGVVMKRKQFSCWNPGDPNRKAMLNIMSLDRDSLEWKRFMQARRIAAEILAGESKDPTGRSYWYHTTGVKPIWSKGIDPIKKFANHLFFRRTL